LEDLDNAVNAGSNKAVDASSNNEHQRHQQQCGDAGQHL
jgi:hypothetical protein